MVKSWKFPSLSRFLSKGKNDRHPWNLRNDHPNRIRIETPSFPRLERLEEREVPTINVVNLSAQGPGSLADAILQANSQAGPDEIVFDASLFAGGPATINAGISGLTFNDPTGVTTVTGPGAHLLTISGNDIGRVFKVHQSQVVMSGLSIAQGNSGSEFGGGVFNDGGNLTLTGVEVRNSQGFYGAAVLNWYGTTTIQNSSIHNNSTNFIAAVASQGGPLTVINSTIAFNQANAINSDNKLTIINSTIANNTGLGISAGGTMEFGNSIFANNSGGDIQNNGVLTATGPNLVKDGSGGMAQTLVADPLLGTLGFHGGTTQTLALLGGSPAANAGNQGLAQAYGIASDQRGLARISSTGIDLGAVENQSPSLNLPQQKTINSWQSFLATGSFSDPDSDTWTATVDFGDGSGAQNLVLGSDKTFSLNHDYASDGLFTVQLSLSDGVNPATVSSLSVKVNRFTVDTTSDTVADDGLLSLPEAFANANTRAGADSIGFSALFQNTQTITLSNNPPALTDSEGITLIGPSAGITITGAALTSDGPLTLTSSATITLGSSLGGSGSLAFNGTGTLFLASANTYSGSTVVNSGTLQLVSGKGLSYVGTQFDMGGPGSGAVSHWRQSTTPKEFDLDGNNVYGSDGYLVVGGNSRSQVPGYVSSFSLTPSTYPGNGGYASIDDPLNPASSIVSGTTNPGTGNVFNFTTTGANIPGKIRLGLMIDGLDWDVFNPSALQIKQVNGSLLSSQTLATTGATYNNRSPDWVFFDIIGAQPGNEYTVFTTVGTGGTSTVQVFAFDSLESFGGSLPNGTQLSIASGATLDLNGQDQTVASLSGAGNLSLGSGTLTTGDATSTTFSGVISGTGGLTKVGTGTFTLGGTAANSFTGTTTVNAGVLALNKSGGAAAIVGPLVIGDGLGGQDADEVRLLSDNQVVGPNAAVSVKSTGLFNLNGNNNTLVSAGGATQAFGGYFNAPGVDESNSYVEIYKLDIPNNAYFNSSAIPYSVDNSLDAPEFDRIAYFLELSSAQYGTQYVWVSMDAFTQDATKIGVPNVASGVLYNRSNTVIANMNVFSNVGSITSGTNIATGGIEFWPSNYGPGNDHGVPGADSGTFDFGDGGASSGGGYGSMQIHNYGAGQTVFAYNRWGYDNGDLGIGNQVGGSGQPDWTFATNVANYTVKNLTVLVRPTFSGASLILERGATSSGKVRLDDGSKGGKLTLGNNKANLGGVVVNSLADTNSSSPAAMITGLSSSVFDLGDATRRFVVTDSSSPTPGVDFEVGVSITSPAGTTLNKEGLGTMALSRANTYAGPTKISQGTLQAKSSGAISAISSMSVETGANLDLNGFDTTLTSLSGTSLSYPATVAGDNPLVYYRFEDTTGATGSQASDSSGRGNHGVYGNNVGLTNPSFGTLGRAANFDNGSTDTFVAVPDLGTHNAITLEAWVNPRSITTFDTIYNTDEFPLGAIHWQLVAGGANLEFTANGWGTHDSFGLSIPANQWSHLVTTYDSSLASNNVKFFLNGSLVGTATVNQQTAILGPAHIGVWASSMSREFDGLIDEFAVYGSALSADRIQAHYRAASTTSSAGVINLGGATLTVSNSTSNLFAGTIVGVGGLIKDGAATLTLSGANTYTGPTVVNAGVLQAAGKNGSAALNVLPVSTAVSIASGANFALNGANQTIGSLAGAGEVNLDGVILTTGDASSTTFSGVIRGSGGLTKTGSGTFTLGGAQSNSYTGTTTVAMGTLALNKGGGAVAIVGPLVVGDGQGGQDADEVRLLADNQVAGSGALVTVRSSGLFNLNGFNNTLSGAGTGFGGYSQAPGVEEASQYFEIYKLNIPNNAYFNSSAIPYSVDNSSNAPEFDRIAYFLELSSAQYGTQYVWVSMDAFTQDATKIGVPNLASGVLYNRSNTVIANMNVFSNVGNISNGTGIATGGIEFWPSNYGPGNDHGVPGADSGTFDFGDGGASSTAGYGSMQIHNYGSSQTIFAYNRWGYDNGDLGIGNQVGGSGQPDWTFAGNVASYTVKNLTVLVRPTLAGSPLNLEKGAAASGRVRLDDGTRGGTLTLGGSQTNTPGVSTFTQSGVGSSSPAAQITGLASSVLDLGGVSRTFFVAAPNSSNPGVGLDVGVTVAGAAGSALTKDGMGTLVLSGSQTYPDGTTIRAGKLVVNGNLAGSALVEAGAILGGSGSVGGLVNQGTVSPGNSPGILTINGNYSQTGSLDVEIAGTNASTPQFDQLQVFGTVTLAGQLNAHLSGGFLATAGDSFEIIHNDGGDKVVGIFDGLPQGSIFLLGDQYFTINYEGGDGNDVVITQSSGLLVTTTADSGPGSLRQAILLANQTPGPDTIRFNIPGSGVQTITVSSALPTLAGGVTIDGYSQPGSKPNTLATGSDAVLLVAINGSGAPGANGLTITGSGNTVRGLIIQGFQGSGIALSETGIGSGSTLFSENFNGYQNGIHNGGQIHTGLALAYAGSLPGWGQSGFHAVHAVQTQPGNYAASFFHTDSITLNQGFAANQAGTTYRVNFDAAPSVYQIGSQANQADDGLIVSLLRADGSTLASYTALPGAWTGQSNSQDLRPFSFDYIGDGTGPVRFQIQTNNPGSGRFGGAIDNLSVTTGGNRIQGNFIGTTADGLSASSNGIGIHLSNGAVGTIIGTDGDGADDFAERNVVSGNTGGAIYVLGANSASNVIAGNYVGTNALGTAAVQNASNGIVIAQGAQNTRIGTDGNGLGDGAERNIISASYYDGIVVEDAQTNNTVIAGNYIGTNALGTAAIPNNRGIWVRFGAQNTRIGTDGSPDAFNANEGNLISGNATDGISITTAQYNGQLPPNGVKTYGTVVAGNSIGTDATGTAAIPNAYSGVALWAGPENTRIGTDGNGVADLVEKNLISGNTGWGVYIAEATTVGTRVSGNFIGTNGTGLAAVPNGSGVFVSSPTTIIGTNSDGNGDGTEGNLISGNNGQGIRLSGVTAQNIIIAGNQIGSTASGLAALGNRNTGISLENGPSNNRIGGANPWERNVIVANGSGSGFPGDGVTLFGANTTNNQVLGNFIGVGADGATPIGNGWAGIRIYGGANNFIGGVTASPGTGAGNVISGNLNFGIFIDQTTATGNQILGNAIGTDITGTLDRGNTQDGIRIQVGAANNIIGGSVPGAGNLISGNNNDGIEINGGTASGNRIEGNFIGTNAAGTGKIGNSVVGVRIVNSPNNTIGGPGASRRNLISGNANQGVLISGLGANFNSIKGNYIGTDVTGELPLGNGSSSIPAASMGVFIFNGPQSNWVGTDGDGIDDALEGNVISGNISDGIKVQTNAPFNVIAGNFIGTNKDGTRVLSNGRSGVFLQSTSQNRVGTNADGVSDDLERNIISGNTTQGVWIATATSTQNVVAGNYIGTDVTGTLDFGNAQDGVRLEQGVTNNTIGGATLAARNLISGNNGDGIEITGSTVTGNIVAGNFIGVQVGGSLPLGNSGHGVNINAGSQGNRVGTDGNGTNDLGERNVISANGVDGVLLHGTNTNLNVVAGNYIGVDASGSLPLGNRGNGIEILAGAAFNRIGTDGSLDAFNASERNIISDSGPAVSSGAGMGVHISQGSSNNIVAGNYIGTDASGTLPLGNRSVFGGLAVSVNSNNTRIGTNGDGIADDLEGNLVSGNAYYGILINTSSGTVIAGNKVGTNAAGTAAIPNLQQGIYLSDGVQGSRVGTNADGVSDALEANLVSGNLSSGIIISGPSATNNTIAGNFVGTQVGGVGRLGNGTGVTITGGARFNTVGGAAPGMGNLIMGSQGAGVTIDSSNNTVSGNTIEGNGLTSAGIPGAITAGVWLGGGSVNTISLNTIRNNYGAGILVGAGSTSNTLSRNTIVGNGQVSGAPGTSHGVASGQIGIDLLSAQDNQNLGSDFYRTLNDDGDLDQGGNGLLNAPVLTSARIVGGNLVVTGFAPANASIELFAVDSSSKGASDGGTYLTTLLEGSAVDSDGSKGFYIFLAVGSETTNKFQFTIPVPAGLSSGQYLNATATLASSTSEFGHKIQIKTEGDGPSGPPATARVLGGPSGPMYEGAPSGTLSAAPVEPGVYTYSWNVTKNGNAFGSPTQGQTFSFTPDDNGSYLVSMTMTREDGSQTTIPWTVGSNLVVNGGFESTPAGLHTPSISGWNLSSGNTIEVGSSLGAVSAFEGNRYLELDSDAPSAIYQDIDTVPGQTYLLSFAYSPKPGVPDNHLQVRWGAQGALTTVSDLTAYGLGLSGSSWRQITVPLVATSSTTRIEFADLSFADGLGALVDDIRVLGSVQTVGNMNPVVVAAANQSALEGTESSFDLGSFSDPGLVDSPWTVEVNWGDGTASTVFTVNQQGTLPQVAHIFPDGSATYTVWVTVTDKDGASHQNFFKVAVSNVAPVYQPSVRQYADEGTTTSFNLGSFSDLGLNDGSWIVSVDWGDGTTESFLANGQGAISPQNHAFPNGNQTYTVTVTVTDKDGGAHQGSFYVDVQNVAPAITAPQAQTVVEGTATSLDLGSFFDRGANDGPWTVEVDWGDGTPWTTYQVAALGDLGLQNHTYDDGRSTRFISLRVTDRDGGVGTLSFPVEVVNAAPTATVSGPSEGVRGQLVGFSIGANDLSQADQQAGFTYTINWGDGSPLQTISQTAGNSSGLVIKHEYQRTGVFTVAVTATDKDGAQSSVSTTSITVQTVSIQNGGELHFGGTLGEAFIKPDGSVGYLGTEFIVDGVLDSANPANTDFTVTMIDRFTGEIEVFHSSDYNPQSLTTIYLWGQYGNDIFNTGNYVGERQIRLSGGDDSVMGGSGKNEIVLSILNPWDIAPVNLTVVGGSGETSENIFRLGVRYVDVITITAPESAGFNEFDFSGADQTITFDMGLVNGTAQQITATGDLLAVTQGSRIDSIIGSTFDDVLKASSNGTIWGGAGKDQIIAPTGSLNVRMDGGLDEDTLINFGHVTNMDGGDGIDSLINHSVLINMDGGDGLDSLINFGTITNMDGGLGEDTLINFGTLTNMDGGDGLDTLTNFAGSFLTNMDGGDGLDTLVNYGTLTHMDGGLGEDILTNYAGSILTNMDGGDGIDTLVNYGTLTHMDGGLGEDILTNYAGSILTNMDGGDGIDSLVNYGTLTNMDGGLGEDILTNYAGAILTNMDGGDGLDTLVNLGSILTNMDGGEGIDTLLNYGTLTNMDGGLGEDILTNYAGAILTNMDGGDGLDTLTNYLGGIVTNMDGGDGIDTLLNGGTILTNMDGGLGEDILTNYAGAIVTNMDGGDGLDILTNYAGGTVTNMDGGDGVDTLLNSGTILTNMDGGLGEDSLTNYLGGIVTNMDGGDGIDTLLNGGTILTNMDGGLGEDILTNYAGAIVTNMDGGDGLDILTNYAGGTVTNMDGGDGVDSLLNSGTILTNMDGGLGEDSLTNYLGGTVTNMDGGDGIDTLLNGGTILTNMDGGLGEDILTNYAGAIVTNMDGGDGLDILTNYAGGTVTNMDGGDGVDTLLNSGTILTNMDGGLGEDSLTNYLGGIVTNMDGGDGIDTLLNGGTILTNMDGGLGNDILTNYSGAIVTNMDGGDGLDILTNFAKGTVTNMDGGDGVDTLLNSGTILTNMDGGLGNDILTNYSGAIVTNMDGGDGLDTLTNFAQGTVTSMDGGLEADILQNAGTILTNMDGGDGLDTLVNFAGGTVTNMDGGLDADTLQNAGTILTSMDGGEGLDILMNFAGGTVTRMDGGLDADTLQNAGTILTSMDGGEGFDSLLNVAGGMVTRMDGGLDNDTLLNHGLIIQMDGGEGLDTLLNFAGGTVTNMDGGLDADTLQNAGTILTSMDGGDGADSLLNVVGGLVTNMDGGLDADILINHGTVTNMDGADGADTLVNTYLVTQMDGGDGVDTLLNTGTVTNMDGGDGADSLINRSIVTSMDGGLDADSLTNSGTVTNMDGGGGADTLENSNLVTNMDGGDGADALLNLGTVTNMSGGEGSDTLVNRFTATSILAGAGDDLIVIMGPSSKVSGGAGSDRYIFAAGKLGSISLIEDAESETDTSVDTLDFSSFPEPGIQLDLALTSQQVVSPNHLSLTLSDALGLENVVGSKGTDVIYGNERNNRLSGAAIQDDRKGASTWNGRTQVVFLDFDTETDPATEHVYTAAERAGIQQKMEELYRPFRVLFTQDRTVAMLLSASTEQNIQFATVLFNGRDDGSDGGEASELDFRNVNLGGEASVQARLGGKGEPAATSENWITLSSNIANHELAHLMGLRHADAFGPIGFGIHNKPGQSKYYPELSMAAGAFETNDHVMSSPAQTGSNQFNDMKKYFFGERESVKLAFNENAPVVPTPGSLLVAEASAQHGDFGSSQELALQPLSVTNTLDAGLNFEKAFVVSAINVVGAISEGGQSDVYAFQGRSGDLINIEVISAAVNRFAGDNIDSVIQVFDQNGQEIAFNDDEFETRDSTIIDLALPGDGTYYIKVSAFRATDTGKYELFLYRFNAGNASDGGDTLLGRGGDDTIDGGLGNDTIDGGAGNNTILGGEGNNTLIATLAGAGVLTNGQWTQWNTTSTLKNIQNIQITGSNQADTLDVSGWTGGGSFVGNGGDDSVTATKDRDFVLGNSQIRASDGLNLTLVGIGNALLTGGAGSNTFDLGAWSGKATIDGLGGTNTLKIQKVADLTLTDTKLTASDGLDLTFNNIQKFDLASTRSFVGSFQTDLSYDLKLSQFASVSITIGRDLTGNIEVVGAAGIGSLTVGRNWLATATVQAASIKTVQIGGNLNGVISVTGNIGSLNVGGSLTGSSRLSANRVDQLTVGQNLSGVLDLAEGFASITVGGGLPGTIGVKQAVGGTLLNLRVGGVTRRILATSATTGLAPSSAVRFSYLYDGSLSGDPQVSIRIQNSDPTNNPIDLSIVTDGVGHLDLARLDSLDAAGKSIASGLRHLQVQGDLLNAPSAAARQFFGLAQTAPGGILLDRDAMGGMAFTGEVRTGSISVQSIQAIAFGAIRDSRGRLTNANQADEDDAKDLFTSTSRFVQSQGTYPVAFAGAQPVAFFMVDRFRGGSFADENILFVNQAPNPGLVTGKIAISYSVKPNGRTEESQVDSIRLQGDGASIETERYIAGEIHTTGSLGDLILESGDGLVANVTAASIFGNILVEDGPITGTIQTTVGDLGSLVRNSQGTVTGVTRIEADGGISGRILARGNLLSSIEADGSISGVIASQGDIGAIVRNAQGNAVTDSRGRLTRFGFIESDGGFSGRIVALGNLFADVEIDGGMNGGRIAVKGSAIAGLASSRQGILGNLEINGSIQSNSVITSAGLIGDSVGGTSFKPDGDIKGIVAAKGAITTSGSVQNKKAAFYGGNLGASAGNSNASMIDALFTEGGVTLGLDSAPGDLLGLTAILNDLNSLKTNTQGNLTGART